MPRTRPTAPVDAGIVAQHVDGAFDGNDILDDRPTPFGLRNIAGQCAGIATQRDDLGHGRLGTFGVHPRHSARLARDGRQMR